MMTDAIIVRVMFLTIAIGSEFTSIGSISTSIAHHGDEEISLLLVIIVDYFLPDRLTEEYRTEVFHRTTGPKRDHPKAQ